MMRTSLWCSTLVAVAVGGAGVGAGAGQQTGGIVLTMSRIPAAVRAGDVALVSVESSSALTSLEGQAFGRAVSFWPAGSQRTWHGLVGVDMDAKAGAYDVEVRGAGDGGAAAGRLALTVAGRRFETRRIQVEERFANPPAEEGDRIRQEAERLAGVLSRSNASRFWQGAFAPPVPGATTSGFGRLTVMNSVPRGRHRGVDFRAAEGTPVLAPNAGVIVLAADLYFTGNTVVVDHGAGLLSLFAHFSSVAVAEGAHVSIGDRLGLAGATGRVTGPHVHWAVRLGGATVDPLSLVSTSSGLGELAQP